MKTDDELKELAAAYLMGITPEIRNMLSIAIIDEYRRGYNDGYNDANNDALKTGHPYTKKIIEESERMSK